MGADHQVDHIPVAELGGLIRAELDNAMGDQRRLARWRIVVLDQQALARYATPLRAVAAPAAQPLTQPATRTPN